MDYKEKFEDFLDKMQGLLDNAKKQGHIIVRVEDLENTLTEIKGSEDERIRKALLKFHKSTIDIDGIKGEQIIGWLEKQKGKDALIKELGEYKVKYTQEVLGSWLEKQSNEPKWRHHKVDLSDCPEEYRKAYYDGWNNCNMQHSQCNSEKNDVIKCLINGMKFYYEDNEEATWGTEKFSMKVKDILSWLEKQEGCEHIKKDWLEHIKQSWYKEGFIDGKYSGGASKEWTTNDAATLKELIDFLENGTAKLQHDLTRYANWLKIQFTPIEKQGYPTDINPSEFDLRLNRLLKQFETLPKEELASSLSFYLNVIQNDGTYKPDEKQGEQKSVDKVEPKFKVGDWITDGNNALLCVEKFEIDYGYELKATDGQIFHFVSPNLVDANYHLWTIQDAKDGDVLCTYECDEPKIVFILKGTPKKHYALSYHCYYNIMYPHFGPDSEKGCLAPNDEDVKPATKEQRDLLFQKIKEEEYEWDAERKELKKIEQKSAEDSCKNSDDITIEEKDMTEYKKGFECGKQRVLKYPEDFGLCKKTLTAWSEEDEKMISRIRSVIEKYAFSQSAVDANGDLCEKEYIDTDNWLKFLKDRVQPKQKWSKEDETKMCAALAFIKSEFPKEGNEEIMEDTIEWLKSLKQRIGG